MSNEITPIITMAISQKALEYVVAESRDTPGEWRAEAIDHDHDGDCYSVLFYGPDAEARASEYARWKMAYENPPPSP